METNPFTKTLKTPSPPAKMKLFLERLDNFNNCNNNTVSTGGYPTGDNSINNDKANNNQPINYLQSDQKTLNQRNLQQQFNQAASMNQQINNVLPNQMSQPRAQMSQPSAQCTNRTTDSLQAGLKTDEFKTAIKQQPLSTESQNRASLTCRTRLGNTGDALTGIVKKYRELQAKSKVSLVLDDSSTDEEDESNNTGCMSDTPSFRCSSDEEELTSSQCTNSLESSSNDKKKLKSSRQYKSEPQLSSFEDSVCICDQTLSL